MIPLVSTAEDASSTTGIHLRGESQPTTDIAARAKLAADLMIEFESAHTGDGVVLKLSGELTVPNAAEFRSALLEALGRLDYLEIDLSPVTAVDIAGLQLLCAAHRTAVTQAKKIVLLSASGCVDMAANNAGFLCREGCMTSPNEGCLWAEGGRRWVSGS